MDKKKQENLLKFAYDKLNLITFLEDRLMIIMITPQDDYKDNREAYVRALGITLMAHGYADMPENRTPMRAERVESKMMEDLSRMFHHLMDEEGVQPTRDFTTFPKMRIQVNKSEGVAYIALGSGKLYRENADAPGDNFLIVDGDNYLWGLVYG